MNTKKPILLIEDDEIDQMTVKRALNELHITNRLDITGNGEEAIEYLKGIDADLLILDMIMEPGIDGLETYKKILEIVPDHKAIIASGFAENRRVKEALRLGAGNYVKKPYSAMNLGTAVRTELDRV